MAKKVKMDIKYGNNCQLKWSKVKSNKGKYSENINNEILRVFVHMISYIMIILGKLFLKTF